MTQYNIESVCSEPVVNSIIIDSELLSSLDSEALEKLEKQIAKEKAERKKDNEWADNGLYIGDYDWEVTWKIGDKFGPFMDRGFSTIGLSFKTTDQAELYRDKQLIRKELWKWAKLHGEPGTYSIAFNGSLTKIDSSVVGVADDLPRMDATSWDKCIQHFNETKGEEYLKTLFRQNP